MTATAYHRDRIFEIDECPPERAAKRKVVAIGDLHGDYYRLQRILEAEEILIPGTTAWNPQALNVDLVLIGDYVDWRGEPLEGDDTDEHPKGSRRIIELIFNLHKQVQQLSAQYEDFDGKLHALRGNHDDMMLEAARVFDFMSVEDVELLCDNLHQFGIVRRRLGELALDAYQVELVMKFLNWYVQGGRQTLEGWDSIDAWRLDMEGELGSFLRNDLMLGTVVNRRLYAHSAPDLTEFWLPLADLHALSAEEQPRLREAFLWSRKLWGFDFYSGGRTSPFSQEELEEMLSGFGVEGVVVGHTPVTNKPEPFRAYEGKVINIDQHGIPGSQAFVEIYDVDPLEVRGNRSNKAIRQARSAQEAVASGTPSAPGSKPEAAVAEADADASAPASSPVEQEASHDDPANASAPVETLQESTAS
jgi:Calcineurin-like phosphoesterase